MLRAPATLTATFLVLALTGCVASPGEEIRTHSVPDPTATEPTEPTAASRAAEEPVSNRDNRPAILASDGRPRHSSLTIPAINLRALRVVAYRGSPDDRPGTRIQNRGVAASPHGHVGGVGPGGVGNHIVTAHRTSSTRAFAELPRLRVGDRVHVVAEETRYTYRITGTRSTSFRSTTSLARQSAAVPGHPGRRPTRPMITLSTCATPEDKARGNHWADEFGNPEHRIDKIGILVATRPA